MNFDKEVRDAFETMSDESPDVQMSVLQDLVEIGYREGRREAFAYKAPAIGALANVLVNIETISDGRVVIYVDDPTRCIVLQKTIPLTPKEEGFHE